MEQILCNQQITASADPQILGSEDDEPPDNYALTPLQYTGLSPFSRSESTIVPFPIHRTVRISPTSTKFRRRFFPGISSKEWNSWQWQVSHRIRHAKQIRAMLNLSPDEEQALDHIGDRLPLGVTPYYMSLLDANDPNQGLRRSVIPTIHELTQGVGEADDPLGEEAQSPIPGLIHRYPDRVLFLVHDFCSTYCRYCTRSRVVGHGAVFPDKKRFERILDYIATHPAIRDVILSGGDPLLLSDERLEWLLSRLRQIPHVEMIRIGTKVPAVLPQRITPHLVRMLRRYHPVWMSLHFTHPDECTPETARACNMLADAGIPLGSQTVLLKGINDNVPTMKQLMHGLIKMRVRPYYLYQCDPISGSAHFRTPVDKGLEIISGLRGHTSGYAVPTFVIDAPGGGGKIPLMPNAVIDRDEQGLTLRNYQKRTFRYPEMC